MAARTCFRSTSFREMKVDSRCYRFRSIFLRLQPMSANSRIFLGRNYFTQSAL